MIVRLENDLVGRVKRLQQHIAEEGAPPTIGDFVVVELIDERGNTVQDFGVIDEILTD